MKENVDLKRFEIGAKVIHAIYGLGIIEEYKKIKMAEEELGFYVISIKSEKLSLMIPEHEVLSGFILRIPCSENDALEAVNTLKKKSQILSEHETGFFLKEYMEKLKAGNIIQLAEVVRDFKRADIDVGLDKESKKFLQRAKKVMIQELSIALNKKEYEVGREIDRIFKKPVVKKK